MQCNTPGASDTHVSGSKRGRSKYSTSYGIGPATSSASSDDGDGSGNGCAEKHNRQARTNRTNRRTISNQRNTQVTPAHYVMPYDSRKQPHRQVGQRFYQLRRQDRQTH